MSTTTPPSSVAAVVAAAEAQRARNALAEARQQARLLRIRELAIRAAEKSQARRAAAGGGKAADGPGARYASATPTRLSRTPRTQGGAPWKHLSPGAHASMRRGVQDLRRNSTIARIIIARAQQLIAGDGPIVTSATDDPAWNALCDHRFNAWFDAMDPSLYGHPDLARRLSGPEMLAATVGAWCTDGDILFVRTSAGALQLIESERVGTSTGERAERGGRTIIDGVEIDAGGAATAYYVRPWTVHGTVAMVPATRIPAEHAELVLNPFGVQTSFIRGEPAFQAVLERIDRVEAFDEATAAAAEIATRFSAIVRTPDPGGIQATLEQSTDGQPASGPRHIDLEPGMLTFLGTAGEVTALKPEHPATNYREYVLWHLGLIGAELGLPLVATLYDARELSWSNIKALLSLSMRSVEPAQDRLARLVRWIRAWRVRLWIEEGVLPARDDYERCEVVMPRAPVVDFASEAEGYAKAVLANLMTQDQATRALGTGSAADIFRARAEEVRLQRDLGITPPTVPGAIVPGAEPVADGEDNQ